jgi:hypothetical protein
VCSWEVRADVEAGMPAVNYERLRVPNITAAYENLKVPR